MKILSNYQNGLNHGYNQNNFVHKNPTTFEGKGIELTKVVFDKFPVHIQERLLRENPNLFQKTADVVAKKRAPKIKTAQKLLVGIKSDISRLQKKAEELELMLQNFTNPAVAKTPAKAAPSDIKTKLAVVLEYKSPRFRVFNEVLDADDCSKEEAQDILDNLRSIRKDYRPVLVSKMIDFAARMKDTSFLEKLKSYSTHSDFWEMRNKASESLVKIDNNKIVDVFYEMKQKVHKNFVFSEEVCDINYESIKLAARSDNKNFVKQLLEFNNLFDTKLNVSPSNLRPVMQNYLKLRLKESPHEHKSLVVNSLLRMFPKLENNINKYYTNSDLKSFLNSQP